MQIVFLYSFSFVPCFFPCAYQRGGFLGLPSLLGVGLFFYFLFMFCFLFYFILTFSVVFTSCTFESLCYCCLLLMVLVVLVDRMGLIQEGCR